MGDTHCPWMDEKALNSVLDFAKAAKPTDIIQMGDLYDFYSFGTHANAVEVTPADELREGRAQAEALWAALKRAAPRARCHQILGNHDERLRRTLRKKAPEFEAVLDALGLNSLFSFKGVQLYDEYRAVVEIDGVAFHHGFGKLGSHMRRFLKPTVVGHLHRGDVEFMHLWDTTIWELNAGFLGDKQSLAFKYTPTKLENWTTGFGFIDEFGPRFIPL